MDVCIQTTDDGSQTLYVPSLDEHYHSTKGALTESLHIFIRMGLLASSASPVRVLEVGFGTGLNALLTLEASLVNSIPVNYTSLERYPLSSDVVSQMLYPRLTSRDMTVEFHALHDAPWNQWTNLASSFRLLKLQTDLTTLHITDSYDVVFFDAFAPEKQPEMWTQSIFNMMFDCLAPEGILVTYCAKGSVRRMMQAAGFSVERLPGPPGGKREILRGRKSLS